MFRIESPRWRGPAAVLAAIGMKMECVVMVDQARQAPSHLGGAHAFFGSTAPDSTLIHYTTCRTRPVHQTCPAHPISESGASKLVGFTSGALHAARERRTTHSLIGRQQ